MKTFLLIISIICFTNFINTYSQYCTDDNRYTELEYFNLSQITTNTNVQFAIAQNFQNKLDTLRMDFYYPNLMIDKSVKRPFIMLFHGGGFVSGDKQEGDIKDLCYHLAMRGFATASVNYRLGQEFTDYGQYKARYRAIQDGHAALRFVVNNANLIRIDTNWIFVGGQSAGAILAQGLVYTDQSEVDSLTTVINSTNISDELGTLKSSGNTFTNTYSIKGVFNNWGAIPEYELDYDEMLPTISFHGVLDSTVSIDYKDQQYFIMNGSRTIHNKLIENNVCSELTIDPIGGHGIYRNEQSLFRAQRASCFFKSIFCNNCNNFFAADKVISSCSETLDINDKNLENELGSEIKIISNISDSYLTIYGNNKCLVTYSIYNLYGLIIKNDLINDKIIDISNLETGLYFIQIGNYSEKFMVVK